MSSSSSATPAWHTLAIDTLARRLGSDPVQGLSAADAARRLETDGPNELSRHDGPSPLRLLLAQFQSVLIIILLIGIGLSAVLGHTLEALSIGVIVLFSAVLGFLQEYRAERAIEALKRLAAPNATVVRGGVEHSIPSREVVAGDILLISAGDRLAADCRLVEAVNLKIDEAALTGESIPVEKHTDALGDAHAPLGDRRCMAYAGTAVTYGRGRALAVGTGMRTEFGRIAGMLQTVETARTPLQRNLDRVGRMLAAAAGAIVLLIVLLGLARGEDPVDLVIFGIALAVAVVPEALPAVVTISLAIGVQRMVKRHALIRRLPAVETLGSVNIICTDKTGTLTKNEMTVRRIFCTDRMIDVSGSGYAPTGTFSLQDASNDAPLRALLTAATLCTDAVLREEEAGDNGTGTRWRIHGDPTEGALVVVAAKAGLHKQELEDAQPRSAEVPFTSESKRMITLHGNRAYAKGAPEMLLSSCTRERTPEGIAPLSDARREELLATARSMAENALRVLAVAQRDDADIANAGDELTFLGFMGMIDPPRTEAAHAIAQCHAAGIRVMMITGDHPVTAAAIAKELSLLQDGRVVTGRDVDALSDAQLKDALPTIDVCARVSPDHKLRVVTLLQELGFIAAMTGDGVNDAPALKKADIGVAMGITGTDVSKEAAAMTLTDDNFASIVAAVEEGRGIFENIKKYLMYLLSSNIGEMLIMTIASVFALPLPLTAVQILYINLVTDGFPALALAVDPQESDIMTRAPRPRGQGIFTRPVVSLMLISGLWSTIVNIGVFVWSLRSGIALAQAMTYVFVLLMLIEFLKAYNFRSDRHSVLRRPFANRWLNVSVAAQILPLLAIVYHPFLQRIFHTSPLAPQEWLLLVACALTIIPVLEMAKWGVRRGWLGRTA